MKLVTAIIIGKACGLETIAECVYNIHIHAASTFSYNKINKELEELDEEMHLFERGILKLDWAYIADELGESL